MHLPLIAYSIETAKISGLFDKIIVSTDSQKIAHTAKEYGAEVPFMRPRNLSEPVILPRGLVQDIDTPEDWESAEAMYDVAKKKELL